jgi:hypothetical protein
VSYILKLGLKWHMEMQKTIGGGGGRNGKEKILERRHREMEEGGG